MKTGATLSRNFSARSALSAVLLALALAGGPALAADDEEPTPVTDEHVGAKQVAMTPLSDLNLKKDPIPEILLEAQNDPYLTKGFDNCKAIATKVREYDTVLGTDFDIAGKEDRQLSAGKVAQSVVGSFIPFRGVIREVSGANDHAKDFQDAIIAGMMRRSFLKGIGLKLGCDYPAAPADAALKARLKAVAEARAAQQQ